MPTCNSDPPALRRPRDGRRPLGDDAVSEVVGFLLTFAIIAAVLVVAMLGFSDAQARAERRVAEVQADSIAQRVAGVIVESAVFLERQNCAGGIVLSVLLELPTDLQGHGYVVQVDDLPGEVTVSSSVTRPRTQALFQAVNDANCQPNVDPRPRLCVPGPPDHEPAAASGGNLYVVYDSRASMPECLGLANSPVT